MLARQLGIKLTQLDPMTREALAVFCRCKAAQSVLDPAVDPERYLRASNGTQRAFAVLERRLRDVGLDGNAADPSAALRRHITKHYGGNESSA